MKSPCIKIFIHFLILSGSSIFLNAQDSTETSLENVPTDWKWQQLQEPISLTINMDTLREANVITEIDHAAWWTHFSYTTLDSLIDLAINQNYSLQIAEKRIGESRSRVRVARSGLFPNLSINPLVNRQEFAANRPLPFDVPATRITINTFSLPFDVSYEVDIFGRIRDNLRASHYDLEAVNAARSDLQLAITTEVAANFFLLVSLDTEYEILERTVTTRKDNLDIVQTRFSAGLVNEIDLQRSKTELASVEVQLKNVLLARTEVELALAILCGQLARNFSVPLTPVQYLAPEIQPENPEYILNHRPDLQEAQLQMKAAEERVNASRKNLLPSFFINGQLGLTSGTLDDWFEGDSRTWLIGGSLSIPIFEGFRRRAELEVSQFQLAAARDEVSRRELVAFQQVENALNSLNRIREQLEAQQVFLEAAQQAATLSKNRYTKGLVTYLEVADAERLELDAERLAAQLLGQQLISTVNLIRALGN